MWCLGCECRIQCVILHCIANSVLACVCVCVAEFSIWTREAGAGGLSIAVEGPSKAEIAFEDRKDGSSGVSYIVQEPGEKRQSLCCTLNHISSL